MTDERTKPPYNQSSAVPVKFNWPTLLKKDGDNLFDHYSHMLERLSTKQIQHFQTPLGRYHTGGINQGIVW
jgi:hypothetical protein